MYQLISKYYWRVRRHFSRVELSYVDRRTAFWKPLLMFLPALAILTMFTIVPIVWVTQDAFTITNRATNTVLGTGTGNFTRIFTDPDFMQALSNSLVYSLVTVPISITIALVISVAIASVLRKWLRGALQTIFFLPYVTASVAVALAFAFLFSQEGLINKLTEDNRQWLSDNDAPGNSLNAMFVVSLQGVWSSLAFEVLILTTALLGIDKSRYKAASIDGAGPIKQFFHITLPSLNRTLNFLLIFGLIGSIKVFPLALFGLDASAANRYGAQTLLMFVFLSISRGQWEQAGAASLILFVVSLAFTVGVRSFFGLARYGIVKGGEWRVQNRLKARY